jgi:hypothetical protein
MRHAPVIIARMANIEHVYQRQGAEGPESVTIMAYLGAEAGDSDEIRRVVVRNGSVIEDRIAYFGTAGSTWLEDQHSAYIADGFHRAPTGTS